MSVSRRHLEVVVTPRQIAEVTGGSRSWVYERLEGLPLTIRTRGGMGKSVSPEDLPSLPPAARKMVKAALEAMEIQRQDDAAEAEERQRDKAVERAELIKRYQEWKHEHRQGSYQQFCDEAHVDVPFRTFQRWLKAWNEGGFKALIPKHDNAGRKPAEIDQRAKDFLIALYCKSSKSAVADCVALTMNEAAKNGWTVPSERTLTRLVESLEESVRIYGQQGYEAWLQKTQPSYRRDPSSIGAHVEWHGDHKQMDVYVLKDGKAIRPWVTSWEDVRTRMVVGWTLTVNPCSQSITKALKRAVQQYGRPEHIRIDNGRDYSGRLLAGGTKRPRKQSDSEVREEKKWKGIYAQVGIPYDNIHYGIVKNARTKVVERWHKTMGTRFESFLPGYVGNSTANRPYDVDADIKAGRLLTYEQLEDRLSGWIHAGYHQHPHYGRGMEGKTPLEVWNELADSTVARRCTESEIRMLFVPYTGAKVGKEGIRLFYNDYWSPELAGYFGRELAVKYDPDDLREIHVYKENWDYLFTLPCVSAKPWHDLESFKADQRIRAKVAKAERERVRGIIENEQRHAAARVTEQYAGVEVPPMKPAGAVQIQQTPFSHELIRHKNIAASSKMPGQLLAIGEPDEDKLTEDFRAHADAVLARAYLSRLE